VFDAVAGVQPQSENGCGGQADKYSVPRICFINKMDRVGADFYHSVQTIVDRLKCRPVSDSASHRRGKRKIPGESWTWLKCAALFGATKPWGAEVRRDRDSGRPAGKGEGIPAST